MVEKQITWLQTDYKVNEVLNIAVAKFKAAGVAQPINDARILLGHSLNKPNERFYGRESDVIKSEYLDDFSCLLYTSPSPRDATLSRMPSSA